ncbi:Exonuclease 3'-5' domain-containing protein 2 [Puccinia graminis f. sp. tritici]|uniref:Exonuclease 3'-5' domain-containing protein 2 n=1 Tax=Puccinia graminis f. sp. tritici TaxID=56615 RepID=A0A5B0PDC3_PUCGR|nr:Exonuclease 3'-5' domain-containing protein 2 [Puccinia graminis f. sp. tritici]KAA1099073.1 Exonuclease 3'-5' domain-containing protein 2 [Puccinia graminis f. sp. tritici]
MAIEAQQLTTPIAEFLRDPFIVKFGVGISGNADKLARNQFTDPTGSKVYSCGWQKPTLPFPQKSANFGLYA